MTQRDGPGPAGSAPTGNGPSDPARPRIRPFLAAPRPEGPQPEGPQPESPQPEGSPPDAGRPEGGERPRPFVLTAGRVDGVDPAISLETQVTARPVPLGAAPVASLAPELQAIIATCAEPVSVAEISARVPLHYGVTKILVGDLRASGYLDVHTADVVNPNDPETILRVIRGLRSIA